MLGRWLRKQFVPWVIAVIVLLAIATFLNPEKWLTPDHEVRSTIILIVVVGAVGLGARLITRWLWRKPVNDR
jgi:uncharacterized membrane protein YadS